MSVPPGRPKGLAAPPWGQRVKRAWGSFHLGPRYLAQADLRLLHHRHGVVTIGPGRVHRLAGDDGRGAFGILVADDRPLPPPGEVIRHEHETLSDARRDHCADLDAGTGGRGYPNIVARLQTAVVRIGRVDLAEHFLLQLSEPRIRARLVAAAFVFDEASA